MRFLGIIPGLSLAYAALAVASDAKKPNIILIMSDDQDRRMGSTDFQPVLRRDIFEQGVQFINHFTNTAQCCPSRAGLLRGQVTHNTNNTHVIAPGGSYDKWLAAGLDEDYLPHWIKKAGYKAEYVGKFLNGNAPKGWDHVDALLDPYTAYYNVPVMSQNGERPVYYKGFHSTDVVRIKALARLDGLLKQADPFYLQISPYSPHVQNDVNTATPLARHIDTLKGLRVPRQPNYNPADEFQAGIGGWPRDLPLLNTGGMAQWLSAMARRAEALQGVDEIIEDVVAMLEANGQLDNTYVVYTSDNGYHLGQHRLPGGKALFYGEDTNLPFAVRGPGVPKNITSTIPGVHVDLAPTFLDIAGLPQADWPPFLDGQSILAQWKNPTGDTGPGAGDGNSKETLAVEFWGSNTVEAPNGGELGAPFTNNTFKTVRILGDRQSWLYSVWCTGKAELYDTVADPYELVNLVGRPEHAALEQRLNALLLVTKSCAEGTCRDPWSVFNAAQPYNVTTDPTAPAEADKISNLAQALDPKYDAFFVSFPRVAFKTCPQAQVVANEAPFYPAAAAQGLGLAHRRTMDSFVVTSAGVAIADKNLYGTPEQRNATLEQVYANARNLTDEEIAVPANGGAAVAKRWGVEPLPEWIRLGHD
ncbi:arylsulfatase [Pyricularia oryzae 70-15]|uniref:Arylsulfatase n=1 Tax=Pyricularia oryzae (strain 70-15 / ATCC MYA-4617 / FGSC 8958) TaxID=242507 RepID=G4MMM7_PYRO7|nr:arylsulfatase [Pyricularia oryzae 70-15]EHA57799.1 arylsulfatase [Pyricularia oryzae 70-15]